MVKVLHITNAHPYDGHPEYGCFIKEQIDSLEGDVENRKVFINAHKNGTREYFRAIKIIKIKSKEADVIHCHHLFSFFTLMLAGVYNKPVVTSFLNDWTKEIKLNIPEFLKKLFCRLGCLKSDVVIFKSFIPDFLISKKFIHLPNGVDPSSFNIIPEIEAKTKLGLDINARYILFVSSKNLYRTQKRYDLYKRVIKELNTKFPNKNYKELTMSVDDRYTALLKFNAASLHLLTSDYEGSPNSVKESLCCGTPVLTRHAGSATDLVENIPWSGAINTDSEVKISEKVHELLSTNVDRINVRESFLQKGITKDAISKRLTAIYRDLVIRKRSK